MSGAAGERRRRAAAGRRSPTPAPAARMRRPGRTALAPAALARRRGRRRRRTALALAAVAAVAAAGCGTATSTDADRARATAAAFLAACSRGDDEAVLHLLADPSQAAFARAGGDGAGCELLLRPAGPVAGAPTPRGPAALAALRVAGSAVDGDAATVTVAAPDGATAALSLQSASGRWQLVAPGGAQ